MMMLPLPLLLLLLLLPVHRLTRLIANGRREQRATRVSDKTINIHNEEHKSLVADA